MARFGRVVPAALFLAAIILLVVLEKRRRRTGFYKYVWHARRRVWAGTIWTVGGLGLCLPLCDRYPLWLAALNCAAVSVAELSFFLRITERHYRIMTAAHRFYKHYSWPCMSIEYFHGGLSLVALLMAQTILLSSLVYLTPVGWQGVAAVGGSTTVFLTVTGSLFWLSNRRLYRAAMERLKKERPEWLETGASRAGGSEGPIDRDGA